MSGIIGKATITFTPPVNNSGSAITLYTVTSSPGGFTASGSSSPIVVPNLSNNTSYTFRVVSKNSIGDSVASSPSNSITTPSIIPEPPNNISAVSGIIGKATITFTPPINNSGSEITLYTVRSSPDGFTGSGTSSPIVVPNLLNNTSYIFTVVSRNSVGDSVASSPSNSITTPPPTVPEPPNNISAIGGNAEATITFTPPINNSGSEITLYTVTSSPGGFTGSRTSSPIVVRNLSINITYTFTVVSKNSVGDSIPSSPSNNIRTGTSIFPDPPTDISAVPGVRQATVSFTPPLYTGGQEIASYNVISSPGGFTGSGRSSPIIVGNLSNNTTYTFTVTTYTFVGSIYSSPSNSITTPP